MNKRQAAAVTRIFDGLHDLGFQHVTVGVGAPPNGRFKTITFETLCQGVMLSKMDGRVGVQVNLHEDARSCSGNQGSEGEE